MHPPRSSSNGLYAIVCLGLLALCGFKFYQDHFKQQKRWQTPSRAIEPLYTALFSDLNKDNPVNLVPQIKAIRERILDHRATAAEGHGAYDLAAKLLEGMVVAGEERTQALESLLKTAAQPRGRLDSKHSTTSTNDHFLAIQVQRRTESLRRRKPALDSLFAQLRTAEREGNAKVPQIPLSESHGTEAIAPALVKVAAQTRNNPLERKAYDRRTVSPWRRAYNDRNGYQPYPYGYQPVPAPNPYSE